MKLNFPTNINIATVYLLRVVGDTLLQVTCTNKMQAHVPPSAKRPNPAVIAPAIKLLSNVISIEPRATFNASLTAFPATLIDTIVYGCIVLAGVKTNFIEDGITVVDTGRTVTNV